MSILPKTSQIANADLRLRDQQVAQQAADTRVSEMQPALNAYAFPVRPGSGAVDWTWDQGDLLVAHDPEWCNAEQAVAVVRLVLGRRITLAGSVTL